MPLYSYQALDGKGRRVKGVLDASSPSLVWQKLRERELYPTEVKETAAEKTAGSRGISLSLFSRIGQSDVTAVTRNLATLLGAGLPLMSALDILVDQTGHQALRQLLAQIREEVREGKSFSAALAPHVRFFTPLYLYMVQAAEAAGTLPTIMERLAVFREQQQAVQARVKSALAYPLLMLLAGSAILFFLVIFVIPSITSIFQEVNQTLPTVTLLLIAISEIIGHYWWLIGLGGAGGFIFLRYILWATPGGQRLRDQIKLRLPLFGPLVRKMAVARFSRTLGTLLQSGVSMLTALEIAQKVVNNSVLTEAIKYAAQEVTHGESLSRPLARGGIFPPMATEMLALGEHSGNLEQMLFRIADAYEKEAETKIMLAVSLVEPLMILLMGLVVGFVVVAILLPLFEMNQLVR